MQHLKHNHSNKDWVDWTEVLKLEQCLRDASAFFQQPHFVFHTSFLVNNALSIKEGNHLELKAFITL